VEKTFELAADSHQIPPFRNELKSLLPTIGFNEKQTGEVLLAVDEALTNIIRHAYQGKSGKIKVTLEDDRDRVKVSIQDFGEPFNPLNMPDPDLPLKKPGGLGVFLIKNLMDEVEYERQSQNANLLHLIKYKQPKK